MSNALFCGRCGRINSGQRSLCKCGFRLRDGISVTIPVKLMPHERRAISQEVNTKYSLALKSLGREQWDQAVDLLEEAISTLPNQEDFEQMIRLIEAGKRVVEKLQLYPERRERIAVDLLYSLSDILMWCLGAQTPGANEHVKEVREYAERINKGEFWLAVTGEFNAGKSTLINALLGSDLLPAENRESTTQITLLERINSGGVKITANGQTWSFDDDASAKEHLKNLRDQELKSQDSKTSIIRVHRQFPISLHGGLILIDTPGLSAEHGKITDQESKLFDGLLVVLRTEQSHDNKLFRTLERIKSAGQDNFWFVLNQKDDRQNKKEREQIYSATCAVIREWPYATSKEVPYVSAKDGLIAHLLKARKVTLVQAEEEHARVVIPLVKDILRTSAAQELSDVEINKLADDLLNLSDLSDLENFIEREINNDRRLHRQIVRVLKRCNVILNEVSADRAKALQNAVEQREIADLDREVSALRDQLAFLDDLKDELNNRSQEIEARIKQKVLGPDGVVDRACKRHFEDIKQYLVNTVENLPSGTSFDGLRQKLYDGAEAQRTKLVEGVHGYFFNALKEIDDSVETALQQSPLNLEDLAGQVGWARELVRWPPSSLASLQPAVDAIMREVGQASVAFGRIDRISRKRIEYQVKNRASELSSRLRRELEKQLEYSRKNAIDIANRYISEQERRIPVQIQTKAEQRGEIVSGIPFLVTRREGEATLMKVWKRLVEHCLAD